MTEREQAVNRDLRALDEAHRLGRITRGEYRIRRRRVLGSLYDSNGVVTARKTLLPPQEAPTAPRTRHAPAGDTQAMSSNALTSLLSMRPGIAWKPLLAWIGGFVLVVMLGYWLLASS